MCFPERYGLVSTNHGVVDSVMRRVAFDTDTAEGCVLVKNERNALRASGGSFKIARTISSTSGSRVQ